jgi:hypothetical protein
MSHAGMWSWNPEVAREGKFCNRSKKSETKEE